MSETKRGMPERQTLLSYLDDYEQRGSETVFVHHRGLRTVRWSYKQLVHEAHRFARELKSRGIGPGDRVLLTGENSPEWAAAFWGCCLAGAVVVPLDKTSTREFIDSVSKQTQAKLLVDPLLNHISRLRDISLSKDLTDDAIVEIIYTSGTTSEPKGVVLTHQNLLANLRPLEREIGKYLKWEKFFHPIRFLNLVPLSHVFGQVMGLFVPQLMGGEVHFHETFNPSEIVRTTRKNRISVIVLVPRVLDALREWVERDYATRELSERLATMEQHGYLRRWWTFRKLHRQFGFKFWAFVSGGATLSERTEDFWQRLGFAVLQGYGMTETAALISVNHPFKRSRGSIGRLMPGYEVKLDEAGEIMVRGASVSPGYWTTSGSVNGREGEWLRTGDVGQLDASGNLFFKGRQKDVIVNAAGLNIYPEDLEAALDRQPEIRASCVVAVEGARGSEPFAAIIPHDRNVNVDTAINRANEQLAEYQQVRRWSIWPEPDFPRTATQKILKRDVALALQSPSLNPSSHPSDLFSSVAPQTRLADLQLDSLGRVELLSSLEDRYQISLDEAAFTAATTVGDVQKLVRGEVEEHAVVPYPYPKWPRWRVVKLIRLALYYTIILPITYVMSRLIISGRENLNGISDPVIFVANHVSLADHALILAALPINLRHKLAVAMEGEILRNWLNPPVGTSLPLRLRWLAEYFLVNLFFHVFPLPKKSGFRRSFAYAGECIDRGISVLVFPEGTRAPRGQMHMGHFKAGIGLLAQALNIPIVPVRLEGLYELKRRKQYFADPGMVRVIIGKPITFPTDATPTAIAQDLEHRFVGHD